MPIKTTEISIRPSVDVEFPNVRMFTADAHIAGQRSKPGLISKSVTLSEDQLVQTEITIWEDGITPFEPHNEQAAEVKAKFQTYCDYNGITVTYTRESI